MDKAEIEMPIRAAPYRHQQEAFALACRLFGLTEGGGCGGDGSSDLRPVREEVSKEAVEGKRA